MSPEKLKELLRRYSLNQCSSREKILIEKWYVHIARNQDHNGPVFDLQPVKQGSFREIKAQINESTTHYRTRKFIAVAASLLLVAGLIALMFIVRQPVFGNYSILATGGNQVKKFILPDSSELWLNADSRIRYPSDFGKDKRELFLDSGEGYFDVTHQPHKPFIVHSGKTITRVLGTAFNIKSNDQDQHVQINVIRGKVSVIYSGSEKKEPVYLLANDQLKVNNIKGTMYKEVADARFFTAWRQDIIRINNESLDIISRLLENRYNVKIIFRDASVSERHFTLAITNADDIADIMKDLSITGDFSYSMNNNEIIISSKNQ